MRSILLVFATGCCMGCGLTDNPDMRELKTSLRITGEEVFAKQDESIAILKENTAALAAIKSLSDKQIELDTEIVSLLKQKEASLATPKPQQLGGDPAALEPQKAPRANPSQAHQPVASPSAVRLYVTSADKAPEPFYCPPCERLAADNEAGKFVGFAVVESDWFEGLKRYPAIRFQDPTGQWKVLYGYDDSTVDTLRRLTSTNQFVSQPRITNPIVSQPDLVSIHNQLHGGGQWTWPGDLATHLRTVHGVDPNGPVSLPRQSAIVNSRFTVRSLPQRSSFVGRSRVTFGKSCPTGGCP